MTSQPAGRRPAGHSPALALAAMALLAGLTIGLVAAYRFRDAIQHHTSSCTPTAGGSATLGLIAAAINLAGVLLALAALVRHRRSALPVFVLTATTVATVSVLAVLADTFVLYAINTCAPLANR